MPADVIDRIDLLAKARPAGMHFTNMRNDISNDGDDSDKDSNNDSDYDSDDESSDGDDNNYDDFIAGVDIHNSDPPDPPNANADETHNNKDEDKEDKNKEYDAPEDDDDVLEDHHDDPAKNIDRALVVPTTLKRLADHTRTLSPTIESRMRQQAQDTGESLVTVQPIDEVTVQPITKKQQKSKKDWLIRLHKQYVEENKKNSGTN
jgi:hypothetical protein